MASEAGAFLKKNKDNILREWVSRVRKCSPTYSKRPEYETTENFRTSFDANVALICDNDTSKIDAHLDRIVGARLGSGFNLGDIFSAIELFRTVSRPFIIKDVRLDKLSEALEKVDSCVEYSILGLFKRYRAYYEEEAKNSNKMLSDALVELKVERNNAMAAGVLKDQFLANLSHELKTPLTSIIGFSKALMNSPSEQPPIKEKMRIIYDQGRTLLRLINTLLTISEINSGTAKIGRDAVDIRDITEMVVQGVKKLPDGEGRKIEFIGDAGEFVVIGDSEKLFSAFSELIINALKFSEPNGEVTVRCFKAEGNVSISVKDNGIGINADDFKIIFDPFYQADGSLTRKYGGNGIGLTLLKKVVVLHGGTVGVESVQGKGSTFTVEIPLAKGLKIR